MNEKPNLIEQISNEIKNIKRKLDENGNNDGILQPSEVFNKNAVNFLLKAFLSIIISTVLTLGLSYLQYGTLEMDMVKWIFYNVIVPFVYLIFIKPILDESNAEKTKLSKNNSLLQSKISELKNEIQEMEKKHQIAMLMKENEFEKERAQLKINLHLKEQYYQSILKKHNIKVNENG